MKIEACCPNCGNDYLGCQYTNPNIKPQGFADNRAEKFSIFNEWQDIELQAKPETQPNGPPSEGVVKITME